MLKQTGIILSLVLIAALLVGTGLPEPAAAGDQEEPHRHDENIEPPPPPKEGNPKLDSHLWDLISANERGQAEEHAQLKDIELVDGGVRVIIKCMPGQCEAAAEAASEGGATQVRSREDSLKALVPITSLNALAEAGSIRSIRVPVRPVTEASD